MSDGRVVRLFKRREAAAMDLLQAVEMIALDAVVVTIRRMARYGFKIVAAPGSPAPELTADAQVGAVEECGFGRRFGLGLRYLGP
jgi:hypothetical protein